MKQKDLDMPALRTTFLAVSLGFRHMHNKLLHSNA